MSASDLPEQNSHKDAHAMARSLVTYMDDPDRIRWAIKRVFQTAPAHQTIIEMRKRHLEPMPVDDPKPTDAYQPQKISDDARVASNQFLIRLMAERTGSREFAA